MQYDEMKQVAWIGDDLVQKPIRGVVVMLHGLGGMGKDGASEDEKAWLAAGLLCVFPYYGPWCWMNRQSRAMVDDLVESVYRHYSLGPEIPLISFGGSMGGLSTLLHARYSRRPVTRCCALFPVCDLRYHFNERPDLPKTIRHAFLGYKESLEDLFIEHSPLFQVPNLPQIPYFVLHGDADKAVNKAQHSDRLVAAMKQRGLNVQYHELPGYGHGGLMPAPVATAMRDFVLGT